MRKLIAFTGFVLLMAGTYCPLLRPFHLFNWDVYAMNKPYGVVIFIIAITGLAAVIAGSHRLSRALAWLSLVLVILLYVAAVMKVKTSFSFIPFKGIASSLARLIKFKWGWYVLAAGAVLSVLSSLGGSKKPRFKKIK